MLESLFRLDDDNKASVISVELRLRSLPHNAATAPATCGVAIDVPLDERVPPASHVEVIDCPGANMSTHVPVLEKLARESADVDAPTVIAVSSPAGEKLHASRPLLPAATTTTISFSIASRTAASSVELLLPPRLKLRTAGSPTT